ncbi:hypothetical protein D3C86_1658570 [compost metagenome]
MHGALLTSKFAQEGASSGSSKGAIEPPGAVSARIRASCTHAPEKPAGEPARGAQPDRPGPGKDVWIRLHSSDSDLQMGAPGRRFDARDGAPPVPCISAGPASIFILASLFAASFLAVVAIRRPAVLSPMPRELMAVTSLLRQRPAPAEESRRQTPRSSQRLRSGSCAR